MALYSVDNPLASFETIAGLPLTAGQVFVGLVNQDPETSPQAVWWDAAGTIPASQPLATKGGYIVRAGTPAVAYTVQPYSIRIRDKSGVEIFYLAKVESALSDFIADFASPAGASLVGFSQTETYASGTAGIHLQLLRGVMDAPYNAKADNSANDSAAMQAAASAGVFVTPSRIIKQDTAISGPYRAVAFGTQFTGAGALDINYPAFGTGALRVFSRGNYNTLVSYAHNDLAPATLSFPTALTGYGRNDNAGNHVFGLYAEARQYASTGVATNEIDSFNHTAAPSGNLPPNLGIGTPENHPIGLQVAAGGAFNSSIGINICQEGSSPQKFLTGIYINPAAVVNYGIFIDSLSTSTHVPAVIKHAVGTLGISLIGIGTPVPANAALSYTDGGGIVRFSVKQDGSLLFTTAITGTTVGAAGGASTLPASPTGYFKIDIGGAIKRVPYYE